MSNREALRSGDVQKMMMLTQGMWMSQIVRSVAALSVPEHLDAGPKTAPEIAAAEASDPEAVFRLLRASVALGLVSFDSETGRFAARSLLSTLDRNAPGTLAGWALVQTAPGHWQSWGEATEAVRAGGSRSEDVLGRPLFEHFAEHKAEGALFSEAMTELTKAIGAEAAASIDMGGVEVAVDVGGANGAFVHEVLRQAPGVDGVVFELPSVVDGAAPETEAAGLRDRVTHTGGDFFESVPQGDLYLLKFVLHDWDDERCVQILRNCRKAMRPGGRVCVVEILVGEAEDPGLDATLMDMNMLMVTQGRERSLTEFDAVLDKAGLRRVKNTPIASPIYPYSVIEAVSRD